MVLSEQLWFAGDFIKPSVPWAVDDAHGADARCVYSPGDLENTTFYHVPPDVLIPCFAAPPILEGYAYQYDRSFFRAVTAVVLMSTRYALSC